MTRRNFFSHTGIIIALKSLEGANIRAGVGNWEEDWKLDGG